MHEEYKKNVQAREDASNNLISQLKEEIDLLKRQTTGTSANKSQENEKQTEIYQLQLRGIFKKVNVLWFLFNFFFFSISVTELESESNKLQISNQNIENLLNFYETVSLVILSTNLT